MRLPTRPSPFFPSLALLALSACSAGEDPARPAPELASAIPSLRTVEPAARAPRAAEPESESEAEEATAEPHPRGLLAHLPPTTAFALRLPHVERLGEAWERSPASTLWEDDEYADARAQLEHALVDLRRNLRRELPDLEELLDAFGRVRGELVVALTDFRVEAFSTRAPSWVGPVVVLFRDEDGGDELARVLERLVEEVEARGGPKVHGDDEGPRTWRRRVTHDGVSLELARRGAVFAVRAAAASEVQPFGELLARRADGDSFADAELARAARALAPDGTTAAYELYLDLQPIFAIAAREAASEDLDVVSALGLDGLRGLAAAATFTDSGLGEGLYVHAPERRDFLSRVLAPGTLDPSIARALPSEHGSAGAIALDLRAWASLAEALKALEDDRRFEEAAGRFADATGLDLREDVLARIGPTFAWSATGDFLRPVGRSVEWALAVEIGAEDAFAELFALAIARARDGGVLVEEEIGGRTFLKLPLDPIEMPNGGRLAFEPTFGPGDGCFHLASSPEVLRRVLEAARDERAAGNAALADALAAAGPDAWLATTSPGGPGQPRASSRGVRTAEGLLLDVRRGPASVEAGALVALPVIASVAIPRLLAARIGANEAKAVVTLRAIASAEERGRRECRWDADRDGSGEYGLLAEVCGERSARTRADGAPLLGGRLVPEDDGVAELDGYRFRVDLVTRELRAVSALASAGEVDADLGEARFVAYAWPVENGSSGRRVFAIDPSGAVYATANDRFDQGYSGRDRPPHANAWCLEEHDVRMQFKEDLHLGGDGGTWRRVE